MNNKDDLQFYISTLLEEQNLRQRANDAAQSKRNKRDIATFFISLLTLLVSIAALIVGIIGLLR